MKKYTHVENINFLATLWDQFYQFYDIVMLVKFLTPPWKKFVIRKLCVVGGIFSFEVVGTASFDKYDFTINSILAIGLVNVYRIFSVLPM